MVTTCRQSLFTKRQWSLQHYILGHTRYKRDAIEGNNNLKLKLSRKDEAIIFKSGIHSFDRQRRFPFLQAFIHKQSCGENDTTGSFELYRSRKVTRIRTVQTKRSQNLTITQITELTSGRFENSCSENRRVEISERIMY